MNSPTMPCHQCGTPVQAGVLGGLCPRCVQRVALMAETGEDDLGATIQITPSVIRRAATPPPSRGWQPPSVEEMQDMLPGYQFHALVGRGGMGAVYEARHLALDRRVAVKILPSDLAGHADTAFMERFTNEARTMAKLSHPGIVDVYDFGTTSGGLLYFAMEFIDGIDASRSIQKQGCLSSDDALAITAHVCDALAYAHENGVIHRDIKPANILISKDGQVKVADFGLAKQSDPDHVGLTQSNIAVGTPDFVAPEALIQGVTLDARADLYAVGVMLYQMLTGEIPRGMWTMPSMKVGSDPRFDEIIARAMQPDREQRYTSAREIRRDLDLIMTTPLPVAKGRAMAAKTPVLGQARHAPAPQAGQTRGRWLGYGAVALLALLAVVWAVVLSRPDKPADATTSSNTVAQVTKDAPVAPKSEPAPAKPESVAPAPPVAQPTDPPAAGTPMPAAVSKTAPVSQPQAKAAVSDLQVPTNVWIPIIDERTPKPAEVWVDGWLESKEVNLLDEYSRGKRTGADFYRKLYAQTINQAIRVKLRLPPAGQDETCATLSLRQTKDSLYGINLKRSLVRISEHRIREQTGKSGMDIVASVPLPSTLSAAPVWVVEAYATGSTLRVVINGREVFASARMGVTEGGNISLNVLTSDNGKVKTWVKEVSFMSLDLTKPLPKPAKEEQQVAQEFLELPAIEPLVPDATRADPRIIALDASFRSRFDPLAGQPFAQSIETLNQGYLRALGSAESEARQQNDQTFLDAIQTERTRLDLGGIVPAEEDLTIPGKLKLLRTTYRTAYRDAVNKRDLAASALYIAYEKTLNSYLSQLVAAGQVSERNAVRRLRDAIGARAYREGEMRDAFPILDLNKDVLEIDGGAPFPVTLEGKALRITTAKFTTSKALSIHVPQRLKALHYEVEVGQPEFERNSGWIAVNLPFEGHPRVSTNSLARVSGTMIVNIQFGPERSPTPGKRGEPVCNVTLLGDTFNVPLIINGPGLIGKDAPLVKISVKRGWYGGEDEIGVTVGKETKTWKGYVWQVLRTPQASKWRYAYALPECLTVGLGGTVQSLGALRFRVLRGTAVDVR